jgi:hypothetical protein
MFADGAMPMLPSRAADRSVSTSPKRLLPTMTSTRGFADEARRERVVVHRLAGHVRVVGRLRRGRGVTDVLDEYTALTRSKAQHYSPLTRP